MTTVRNTPRSTPKTKQDKVLRQTAAKPRKPLARAVRGATAAIPPEYLDAAARMRAVERSRCVVEYAMDGSVIGANENFLRALGYTREEIAGVTHDFFLDAAERGSIGQRKLWDGLRQGEFSSGEYMYVGKGARTIYLQATVNPVFGADLKPYKVAVFASDVTAKKQAAADYQSQIEAISKSQAMIEFGLDGTILKANDNFLNLLGYSLSEIQGKHHGMFVEESFRTSTAYKEFWNDLNRGRFQFGEFKRVCKSGKEIYIQATYNPVFDLNGKAYKVVKFASDTTSQAKLRIQAEALKEEERMAARERQAKIDSLLESVGAAANGDLTREIHISGSDVAGQMGEGLARLFADLRKSIDGIGQTAASVSSSAEELSAIAQQMTGNSQNAAEQAMGVSSASEQVSANVSIVAASSEEMLASIREISKSATEAARVAKKAVNLADATSQTISDLGMSSQEIGKVIKVITSIAQQTNLLALNATIEAARAGEAGKGFAVVANEVKELAKETARATEEISQKIDAIQSNTKAAVKAIADVSEIINHVDDISSTIASAVEEQTATTNEIGRNVAEAARGTNEITQNIRSVAASAEETTVAARGIEAAALTLTSMSSQLGTLVRRFQI